MKRKGHAAKGHTSKHVGTSKHHATSKHHPKHQVKAVGHGVIGGGSGGAAHVKAKHPHHARGLAIGDWLPVCSSEALAMSLRLAGGAVSDEDVLRLHLLAAGAEDAEASILAALEAAAEFGLADARPRALRLVAFPAERRDVIAGGDEVDLIGFELNGAAEFYFHEVEIGRQEPGSRGAQGYRQADQFFGGNPTLAMFGLPYGLAYPGGESERPHPLGEIFLLDGETAALCPEISSECVIESRHASNSCTESLILGVDLPGPHAVLATPDGWWSWGELWTPWTTAISEAWVVTWQ